MGGFKPSFFRPLYTLLSMWSSHGLGPGEKSLGPYYKEMPLETMILLSRGRTESDPPRSFSLGVSLIRMVILQWADVDVCPRAQLRK